MYKLIDENGEEHFYHSIKRITSVADLKQGYQYIFIQEENNIAIWQVVNDNGAELWPMKQATKELADYYKRSCDRIFDTMQKKLLYL